MVLRLILGTIFLLRLWERSPLEESRAGEPPAGPDLQNIDIGPPYIIVWVNMGALGHTSCMTGSSGAPADGMNASGFDVATTKQK